MSFRLKVTKSNGREYAAIVENVYVSGIRGSSSRTVRTYGDLVKQRQTNPDIDEEIAREVARLNDDADAARKAWADRHLRKAQSECKKVMKQANYGIFFYRRLWESLKLHTWFDRARRNAG